MRDGPIRLKNLWWRLRAGPRPKLAEFAGTIEDVVDASDSGKAAELFFSHTGRPTHKWLHYFAVYDQLFGDLINSKVKLLEIGVSQGGSLQIWRRLLGPQATIFGVDVNPACADLGGADAQVRIGSQADETFMRATVSEMGGCDVVIDDGSHVAKHQRASFDALFPLLSDGGLYVIEDLHTAYWPRFEGGLRRAGTAIEFLKDKVDAMHAHYRHTGLNRPDAIVPIESIQFFDSIAVIRKRSQRPRRHFEFPAK